MKRHLVRLWLPLLLGLFTACTHRAIQPPAPGSGIFGQWVAVDPEGTTQTIALLFDKFGRIAYTSNTKGDEQRAIGKYEFSPKDNSFKATIQVKGATLSLDGHQTNDDTLVVELKSSNSDVKDFHSAVRFSRKLRDSSPGKLNGE
jgi:hypothetical protein